MKQDFYNKLLNIESEFTIDELGENLNLIHILMDIVTAIKVLEMIFNNLSENLDIIDIDKLLELVELKVERRKENGGQ